MRLMFANVLAFCLLAGGLLPTVVAAEIREPEEKKETPFDHLEWRSIGPVNMTGRVVDVEGVSGDPNVVWVGAAAGGIWKSTNGGLTFDPVFDDEDVASIGDLGLAPSNPAVVYAGTGEANVRNSVSFGRGVYRTTDGGQSWRFLGLEDTRHISRVIVHPNDPDTVWVGALGHIFGPNEERGVFKSTDGGETWRKVLYLDDRHGVADLDVDINNPNVVIAGLWHFDRKPWTHTSGSEEGGIFRSVDGGETWEKITAGLPKLMGRTGVKIAPSNSNVVYVIAESNEGVLFRSDDAGKTFKKVSEELNIVSRGLYYTDMRVDPTNENRVFAVSSRLFRSIDGGKNFDQISQSTHVDYHSLWIDPEDPRRLWQGQDGGVAVSYDGGDTWDVIRNIPIAQFYQIFHDDREPFYYLGGGLQDNGTWYGPSRTREPAGILSDDWRIISFGDAYFTVPHPEQVDLFISEWQGGGIQRTDMRTRQQIDISPQPRRNDGGPVENQEYRFNWNSPIIQSPHDPHKIYFAGNVVFVTEDFGDTWKEISPDLTTNDKEKQGNAGGPVWFENTAAEWHCTIISFAESPAEAGVLWAGTDDGNLQISRDSGSEWTNVIGNVDVPANSPVSHVEPSRTAGGTAYLSFDRHMFDDPAPHIFKTTDYGATWRRLKTDFEPASYVWVVREDPKNTDLIYAGTELGLFASYDAGESWQRFHLANFPTAPVHDILIHPRHNDLLLGTHGRAMWVFDDATPLQNWSDEIAEQNAHLFPVRPTMRFPKRFTRYGMGDKKHKAPNPPDGALITYYLKENLDLKENLEAPPKAAEDKEKKEEATEESTGEGTEKVAQKPEERIKIRILNAEGEVIRTLDNDELGKKAGLNRIAWNLAEDGPRQRRDDAPRGRRGVFGGPPVGPAVLPGTYTVQMEVDGETWETPVEVTMDPHLEVSLADLKAQHTAASKLVEMVSGNNDTLRKMDALRAQMKAHQAFAKSIKRELSEEGQEAWKAFEEKLTELAERVTRPEGKTFWSVGPRHSEGVNGLLGNLDDAFAAPTIYQEKLLVTLTEEHQEILADWETLMSEDLAALNVALGADGLTSLTVPILTEE